MFSGFYGQQISFHGSEESAPPENIALSELSDGVKPLQFSHHRAESEEIGIQSTLPFPPENEKRRIFWLPVFVA